MTQVPEADLLTICRGAPMELFQKALALVNANIKDPNTNPTQKRKITLKFDIAPYRDRSGAEVVIGVETKTSSHQGVNGTIYLRKSATGYEAFTQDVTQMEIFGSEETPAEEPAPKVTRPQ